MDEQARNAVQKQLEECGQKTMKSSEQLTHDLNTVKTSWRKFKAARVALDSAKVHMENIMELQNLLLEHDPVNAKANLKNIEDLKTVMKQLGKLAGKAKKEPNEQ